MKLGLYQHYKGNLYHVLGLCRHSETLEGMVVYQALYSDYRLWVRPRPMFDSKIEYKGQQRPRFQYIGETFTQFPSIDQNQH